MISLRNNLFVSLEDDYTSKTFSLIRPCNLSRLTCSVKNNYPFLPLINSSLEILHWNTPPTFIFIRFLLKMFLFLTPLPLFIDIVPCIVINSTRIPHTRARASIIVLHHLPRWSRRVTGSWGRGEGGGGSWKRRLHPRGTMAIFPGFSRMLVDKEKQFHERLSSGVSAGNSRRSFSMLLFFFAPKFTCCAILFATNHSGT